MSRLIDADALIALVQDSTILGDGFKYAFVALVKGEPTVDAVEVVRCGECKYSHPYMLGLYRCDRTDIALATGKDEYCSRGERKEDVSN